MIGKRKKIVVLMLGILFLLYSIGNAQMYSACSQPTKFRIIAGTNNDSNSFTQLKVKQNLAKGITTHFAYTYNWMNKGYDLQLSNNIKSGKLFIKNGWKYKEDDLYSNLLLTYLYKNWHGNYILSNFFTPDGFLKNVSQNISLGYKLTNKDKNIAVITLARNLKDSENYYINFRLWIDNNNWLQTAYNPNTEQLKLMVFLHWS